jgi:F-type H+-transporting ATPase subunit alpha
MAAASDPVPMQYIAPFTGIAIAEHFMYEGKDVLIVYDDLSKHAVAYRSISLLLKRPAGREAYPGDIFYIHSRLLERSAKLSKKLGGGSITALPIIETLSGDISAYIPTNVISITDGQIYLESDLFNAGQLPAINVGLSVSRVGGSAQTKLMRALSSKLRLDLAHYRELALFSQFGSGLDNATKEILSYGSKIEEAFRQPENAPLSPLREHLYLFAIANKYLTRIEKKKIKGFLNEYLNFVLSAAPAAAKEIQEKGELSSENQAHLVAVTEEFIDFFIAQ